MTALKLLDAWMGKGSPALRLATTRAHNLPRGDCERVIVELLLRGCLKEDFHFTPYSTISYLVPGVYTHTSTHTSPHAHTHTCSLYIYLPHVTFVFISICTILRRIRGSEVYNY